MIKLGVNSVLFQGRELDVAMKHIAWAGYDGIELSAIQGMCEHLVLDNWQPQADTIQKLAAENHLELLSTEVASLDEARLTKAFEACSAIGIPVINVGPGGKSNVEEDFVQQTDQIARMADKAATYGVTLCCKAHVGGSIFDTPTTLRAMKKIASKGFGVDMDPSHIYRAGELPEKALPAVRLNNIGFVFQGFNLFPALTAAENVEVALDLKGIRGSAAHKRSRALLEEVGLADKVISFPGDLSGCQKQRVAIARALAGDPEIILADEPTAALDKTSGRVVTEMLRSLASRRGRAAAIVTHDNRVMEYADRIVHIEDGKVGAVLTRNEAMQFSGAEA